MYLLQYQRLRGQTRNWAMFIDGNVVWAVPGSNILGALWLHICKFSKLLLHALFDTASKSGHIAYICVYVLCVYVQMRVKTTGLMILRILLPF